MQTLKLIELAIKHSNNIDKITSTYDTTNFSELRSKFIEELLNYKKQYNKIMNITEGDTENK